MFTNWYFYGVLITLSLISFIYSVFYWKRKRNNFRSLPLKKQIHTLLLISLLSATGITIVLLISKISPLMIIPSTRIAFEGIFVKLGGFVFGPIVGVVMALVIEFVVLIIVPTYFHIYYSLVLISFGFVSGMIKFLINKVQKTKWHFLIIYISLFIFAGLSLGYLIWENLEELKKIEIFSFTKMLIILNFFGFFCLFFVIILLNTTLISKKIRWKWINQKNVRNFISILLLAIFTEYIISVCVATEANRVVFGENKNSFNILFNGAILIAPLKIIFNTFIIYQSWKTMNTYLKFKQTI